MSVVAGLESKPIQQYRDTGAAQVDFDLHGLMTIRLIDPSPVDVERTGRQLGLRPSTHGDEPALTIRFVDRIPISSTLNLLDKDDVGFTDDEFLILPPRYGGPGRAQIPMNRIGPGCEIVCERGISEIPLLVPIVNLIVLSTGAVALHASAFVYHGQGVLATGWAKGGKTETLLAFMANGAKFIGDEWIYLDPHRGLAFGLDRPFGVWYWVLRQVPDYGACIGRRSRLRLDAVRHVSAIVRNSLQISGARRGIGARAVRKVLLELERNLRVNLDPRLVFGDEACMFQSSIDRVLFVGSHESSDTTVRPISVRDIVRRMVFSLQYERTELMSYYVKFRFAFPSRRNPLIEHCGELETEALKKALDGKAAYALDHPYPVSLQSLFDAISAYCR